MPVNERYFVKSFEEDFKTKTLKGDRKVSFQSIQDVIKTGRIKPNTVSFGSKARLSTTILSKGYHKTYRSRGIIFTTKQNPDYIAPFDLVLLTNAKKVITQYYRIKENLHVYYNYRLMKGYEKFMFKDFESMIKRFPSKTRIWKSITEFRKKNNMPPLSKSKHKLIEYNEAVFSKPVAIKPVAIFGYEPLSRKIANRCGLPHFRSAKEFAEKYLS
jgi:hypothetical protein